MMTQSACISTTQTLLIPKHALQRILNRKILTLRSENSCFSSLSLFSCLLFFFFFHMLVFVDDIPEAASVKERKSNDTAQPLVYAVSYNWEPELFVNIFETFGFSLKNLQTLFRSTLRQKSQQLSVCRTSFWVPRSRVSW